jgi:hypothetical protein
LKKRMTMKKAARGDFDIDADEEAKILGTEAPDRRGSIMPAKPGAGGAAGPAGAAAKPAPTS